LTYSKIDLSNSRTKPNISRIKEITEEDEVFAKDSEQTGQQLTQGTDLAESSNDVHVDTALGYDHELERFTRIDFEVVVSSEPLCGAIKNLDNLVVSLFTLVKEQGYQGHMSSAELSKVQSTLRSFSTDVQALIKERWFAEIDSNSFLLSGNIDYKAYFDLLRNWVEIRCEAITMYRKFRSDGLFIIPANLRDLLTSCGDCVKTLRASYNANGHKLKPKGETSDTGSETSSSGFSTNSDPSTFSIGGIFDMGGVRAGMPKAIGQIDSDALQDHKMQLMLLKRQNKRRLMLARQKQDSMAPPSGNHALQDLEMLLMLLEQQKKLVLVMAGLEQEWLSLGIFPHGKRASRRLKTP
jgi:hypothetical protein